MKKGLGQKDVTKNICIPDESYRTRTECSMGKAIISSKVSQTVRGKKKGHKKEARKRNVVIALMLC